MTKALVGDLLAFGALNKSWCRDDLVALGSEPDELVGRRGLLGSSLPGA
jgi:hypothetical protein